MLGALALRGLGGIAIVPSDAVAGNQGPFRSLYVGGAGDVSLVGLDGASVLFRTVPAGTTLPLGLVRVNVTQTTATQMTGIT